MVVIAGLLAVASTAWLVGVNPPQAGSAHGTHLTRPSQLGSGHAQPSQALSGQPAPSLSRTSQPAPIQTGASPAPTGSTAPGSTAPGQTGHSQGGHSHGRASQGGHSQAGSGRSGTSRSGTGRGRAGHPGASQSGTHRTRSGQAGTNGAGNGQAGPGQSGSGPARTGPGGSRPAGSSPSRTGQSGTGGGTTRTTPPTPHPRRSTTTSRGGGRHRHASPGIVSIARSLAGREDARRVAALLDRYFAAVNHREYQAYARLFAQPRQLTPREFAWGYRTSHDSKALLAGIAALKGGLRATVTFTSHQDPAQSPDHSSCIDWRITLFLHRSGHGTQPAYLIGMPPSGYRAGLQACRFAPRSSSQARSGHRSTQHRSSPRRTTKHRATKHQATQHTATRHTSSRHPRRKPPLARAIRSDRRRRRHLAVESSGSIIAGCWM